MGDIRQHLKQVPNLKAYKRLNKKDFKELNKLNEQYEEKYNDLPAIKFFQYQDQPGLIAIYYHEEKEFAKIGLVAEKKGD